VLMSWLCAPVVLPPPELPVAFMLVDWVLKFLVVDVEVVVIVDVVVSVVYFRATKRSGFTPTTGALSWPRMACCLPALCKTPSVLVMTRLRKLLV